MNQRESETTDTVIRIEAENPTALDGEPVVARPVPLTAGMAGDADVVSAGDEADDLRDEIAETRTELSETLAAIEAKLTPQHLMAQAKDTVQETTEHVVAQAKHAAHEAVVDAMDHTKEAVHDATIGKVEHMVSNVTDAAKNLVGGATGTTHADTETAYYGTDTRSAPPSYGTAVTAQPAAGVGASLWETLKENPLPTALAAASLGWLFAHRANQARNATASRTSDASYPRPVVQGQGTVRVSGDSPSVSAKAGQVASQVGSTIGDTAGTLQDKAGQVASQVGSTVSDVGNTVGSTVGSTAGQVGSTVGQVAGQAGQVASGLVEGTQQQAQRAQGQFQRVLHDNPLAVGAAALALGAAVGLVIPETQRENQALGAARDSVMDRALGTVQDTMQKVGTIAQKAESAAEDVAKDEAHAQGLVR